MDTSVTLAVMILECNSGERRRKRKKLSKDWYLKLEVSRRVNLLKELRAKEAEDYLNFLRMDETAFDQLLILVEPLIRKEKTVIRLSIPRDSSKNFLSVSLLENIAISTLGNLG